jgi:hypothetical protein
MNFPKDLQHLFFQYPKFMTINIQHLAPVITRFYQEYTPNAYAVLLSGSLMDDKIHEKSDLDVTIFVTDQDQSYNEDFVFEGIKIQAIFISMRQLPIILQQDYSTAQGNQIGMFAKGHIIHDTNNFLVSLIDYCKRVFAMNPPKIPRSHIYALYLDVVQLYQKIHTESFEDNFFQVPDLAQKLAQLNLYYHQQWTSNRKFLFEQIRNLNPVFQEQLFEATTDFFVNKNAQKLIELTKENLSSFLDLTEINSNNTGFSEVKGNHLVMCLALENTELPQDALKRFLVVISKDSDIKFCAYRTLSSEESLREYDSLIIVLSAPNELLNSLLPKIQNIIQSINNELFTQIRYPANIDIKFGFGNQYGLVEPLFCKLSSFIFNKESELSETEKIVFSIDIIVMIGKLVFQDFAQFSLFLRYVYTSWLPKSYDTGRIYGFAQIVQSKEKTEKIFKQNSQVQAIQLRAILQDILVWEEHSFLILPDELKEYLSIFATNNATYNAFELHPVYDFLPSEINTSQFTFLKNTIEKILEIFFIEESQKAYIISLIQTLYEK